MLLVLVVIHVLDLCDAAKGFNVTYIGQKKSWKQAMTHCHDNRGVLESNITVIEQYNKGRQGFWMGAYISQWVGYYGCYQLNTAQCPEYTVEYNDIFQCQLFCPRSKYGFFSVQGTRCYCVSDRGQEGGDEMCTCDNCAYFKIYKQNIEADKTGTSDKHKTAMCMAAECLTEDNSLVISTEECSQDYKVLCEKEQILIEPPYSRQSKASAVCRSNNSSLKWFKHTFCAREPTPTGPHWTSITRKILHLSINEYTLKNATFDPTMCGFGKPINDTGNVQMSFATCEGKFPFFCRFGVIQDDDENGDDDEEDNVTPTTSNENEASTSSMTESSLDATEKEITGIVLGIIGAVVIVIVIVVFVMIYRRRNSGTSTTKFTKAKHTVQRSSNSELKNDSGNNEVFYHEVDTKSENYSYATAAYSKRDTSEKASPLAVTSDDKDVSNKSTGKEHINIELNDDHINTYEHPNTEQYENRSPGSVPKNTLDQATTNVSKDQNPISIQSNAMNSSDYCFATPVEEEEDEYAANKDYDHLHNVEKRGHNSVHNVYDHLPDTLEGDVTYDHSNFTASRSADENYDHFHLESSQE